MKMNDPRRDRETKFKLSYLADNLKLDNKEMLKLLNDVMVETETLIGKLLTMEGVLVGMKEVLNDTKLSFIDSFNDDKYEEYFNKNIQEYDFLNDNQKIAYKQLENTFRRTIVKYIELKSDLIILRKTLNSFLQNRVNDINNVVDVSTISKILMNEYSYEETLMNYGFNPLKDELGLPYLDRLTFDRNGVIVALDENSTFDKTLI